MFSNKSGIKVSNQWNKVSTNKGFEVLLKLNV